MKSFIYAPLFSSFLNFFFQGKLDSNNCKKQKVIFTTATMNISVCQDFSPNLARDYKP